MEENAKKSKKSLLVIVFAIVLIGVGAALIVTGNNKSFLKEDKKESNENKNENKEETPQDDPQRGIVPVTLTKEDVINLIFQKKNEELSEETWSVGNVEIIAHDENYEKYLVSYEEINEDGTVRILQTIVTVIADEKYVELPGWEEGQRDLTVYNFIYETIETPIEPVDPNQPVEPVDPNQPVEPVDPNQPVEPVDPNQPVEPVDPNQPAEPVDPSQPVEPVDPS